MWAAIRARLEARESVDDLVPRRRFRATGPQLLAAWKDWTAAAQEDEIVAALADVQRILQCLYPNLETLHVQSISWRAPIARRFGRYTPIYREAIKQLGLTREESLARRERYLQETRARAYHQQEIMSEADVYAAIDRCYNSYNYAFNAVAVMLATGLRVTEVLQLSKLTGAGDAQVRIEGLAKKGQDKVITRPLVRLRWTHVESLMRIVRRDAKFSSHAADSVNHAMRDLFPGLDLTSHKCRYIWASLAWQLYGNAPQQEWVRSMFGHDNADTTITYLAYTIKRSPDAAAFDGSKRDEVYAELANSPGISLPPSEKHRRLELLAADEQTAAAYGYSVSAWRKWRSTMQKTCVGNGTLLPTGESIHADILVLDRGADAHSPRDDHLNGDAVRVAVLEKDVAVHRDGMRVCTSVEDPVEDGILHNPHGDVILQTMRNLEEHDNLFE